MLTFVCAFLSDLPQTKVQAAWEWGIHQNQSEAIERCGHVLARFFDFRSRLRDGLAFFTWSIEKTLSFKAQNKQAEVMYLKLCTWRAFFLHKLGDNEDAHKLLQESMAYADELNDTKWLILCLSIQEALFSEKGEYLKSNPIARRHLELCRQLNDSHGQINALIAVCGNEDLMGNVKEARLLAEEAFQIATDSGDVHSQMVVNNTLGVLASQIPDYELSIAHYETAKEQSLSLGNMLYLSLINDNLGSLTLYHGRFAEASTYYQDAYQISQEIGWLRTQAIALSNLGYTLTQQGRLSEARQLYLEARSLFAELEADRDEVWLDYHVAYTNLKTGAFEDAKAQLIQVLEQIQDEMFFRCTVLLSLSMTYRILGIENFGQNHAQEGLEVAQKLEDAYMLTHASTCLAIILADQGYLDRAQSICEGVLDTETNLSPQHLFDLYSTLTLIENKREQFARALVHVETVLASLDESVVASMRGYEIYLICFETLQASDDPRRGELLQTARKQLLFIANQITEEEAQKQFLQIPAHQEILQKGQTVQNLSQPAKAPPKPTHGLTKRELQVLRLITRNYTNAQIAEELVLSISTVKRHVYNIYQKLGVTHRVEAVNLSRELGICDDNGSG